MARGDKSSTVTDASFQWRAQGGGGAGGARAPAPLRSDGKVPLRSGAPGLRFLPRVGVFDITIFDRGR